MSLRLSGFYWPVAWQAAQDHLWKKEAEITLGFLLPFLFCFPGSFYCVTSISPVNKVTDILQGKC